LNPPAFPISVLFPFIEIRPSEEVRLPIQLEQWKPIMDPPALDLQDIGDDAIEQKTAFLYQKVWSRSFMAFEDFFMWVAGECPARCKLAMASAIVLRRRAVADRKKAPLSFESGAFQNLQFLHCSHSVSAMCSQRFHCKLLCSPYAVR
jgi:hypothetical protein